MLRNFRSEWPSVMAYTLLAFDCIRRPGYHGRTERDLRLCQAVVDVGLSENETADETDGRLIYGR